ncbi:hypothetical protein CPB84DRAFT_1780750 [Gymnopilus junonius]|uniref:Polysaccharide lyase 14 domain-containing protein n=1 Tax=Gymnopilus junonius TaxID=109634 RepID=A0A9P5NJM1_GYMJU|nr:hypothetical protein CPB84DRAFT_1780750 [Gymnopilus junonius]
MFSSKAFLFFLVFFTISAIAHPIRRRSSCPAVHRPSPSVASLASKVTSTSSSRTASSTGITSSQDRRNSNFSKSWTTAPSSNKALPLTDSTSGRIMSSTLLCIRAMKAHYPQAGRGFSFYAPGPSTVDLTTAKEATFRIQLGGKLPGLCKWRKHEEDSIGCSGGSRSAACFSARLMWRDDGKGEFYTYLPPYTDPQFAANKAVCDVPPLSDCNPTFGASVARGSFHFAVGAWTTISERANGELQLFVNGKSVINVGGLILRDSAAGRIRGMQMQTFFGGSHPEFKSPKAQDTYFSDFSIAITEKL